MCILLTLDLNTVLGQPTEGNNVNGVGFYSIIFFFVLKSIVIYFCG